MHKLDDVLQTVFKEDYTLTEKTSVVFGVGRIGSQDFHLLGVKESTDFGVDQALIMAEKALAIIDSGSTAPVFLLVDVTGQQLSRRDEWLGMHQYFSHLLLCLECLRTHGNRLISLVYNQAIGGAFIAYGLMADTILALPDAKVAVMWLEAMARVTKLDLSRLQELSKTSPVFAPGVTNFQALGGISEVVDLAQLSNVLLRVAAETGQTDLRAENGYRRGGRQLAYPVIQQVLVSKP